MKLEEELNKYFDTHENLPIALKRISYGKYRFGTLKVLMNLKCGRDDTVNLNIRVGGGYISLQKFLLNFLPSEIAKMKSSKAFREYVTEKTKEKSPGKSHAELI